MLIVPCSDLACFQRYSNILAHTLCVSETYKVVTEIAEVHREVIRSYENRERRTSREMHSSNAIRLITGRKIVVLKKWNHPMMNRKRLVKTSRITNWFYK